MKGKIWIAVGVAAVAGLVYYLRSRRNKEQVSLPERENERHHLTNVFSKAKRVAMGN